MAETFLRCWVGNWSRGDAALTDGPEVKGSGQIRETSGRTRMAFTMMDRVKRDLWVANCPGLSLPDRVPLTAPLTDPRCGHVCL